jgi:1-acyl-sn-glycerol-3-phosphate acyltransferase
MIVSEPVVEQAEIAKWDPEFARGVINRVRPVLKRWFRSEVRGLDRIPLGGALVVSNHSGGLFTVDVPVFAADFYDRYGYDRPVYTLSHDILLHGSMGRALSRLGLIRASRDNAAEALRSGGVVVVFPGGEYDANRSTLAAHKIDFAGRTGYVRAAIEAGVPIVPMVSIGAQENQFYITRGDWLAKRLGVMRRFRMELFPITFGVPFGLSVAFPLNLPLPTKIVTEVLGPIDITTTFGPNADVDEVDAHVRSLMQEALNKLARERRFPVLG